MEKQELKVTDSISFTEELTITAISAFWIYFPAQLRALKKSRELVKDAELMGLNFLTISCLTSFLESIISEALLELLHPLKKLSKDNQNMLRIIDDFENRIHSSTFQKYNETLKAITGKKLKDFTDQDTWECVSHLFTFRNQVVHGKRFSYSMTYTDDQAELIELADSYKTVHEYFIRKGLLTKEEIKSNQYYMLKSEMIDFFIEKTILFFNEFIKNISDENDLITYQNMVYIRTEMDKYLKKEAKENS